MQNADKTFNTNTRFLFHSLNNHIQNKETLLLLYRKFTANFKLDSL